MKVWVTVARDRTGREGRFKGAWRVKKGAGKYRTRVVFGGEVVGGDARLVGRVGRAQQHRAAALGPGEVDPELEAGHRHEVPVAQLPGEWQELVLEVGEVDVVPAA